MGIGTPQYQSLLTSVHDAAGVRLDTAVRAFQCKLALLLVEHRRLLGPVGQDEHREQADEDRRETLHDEEKLPVRHGRVGVLDAECDKPPKRARDRGEPEPVRHAHPHFLLRVEERYEDASQVFTSATRCPQKRDENTGRWGVLTHIERDPGPEARLEYAEPDTRDHQTGEVERGGLGEGSSAYRQHVHEAKQRTAVP